MTVLKDPPDRKSSDPKRIAGDAAERQMAFYLRRAFGKSSDVFVINDLRLVEVDDAAQIDHLVLHAGGAVVIESKSVTQKVSVNSRGEWARMWNGNWSGMASPIMQARQQARFLRDYMHQRRKVVRGAVGALIYRGFSEFDIQVVVAVSNDGIIKRDRPSTAPEAMKADQVIFAVEEIIERQRKAAGIAKFLPSVDEVVKALRPQELERLIDILLEAHTPRDGEPSIPDAPPKRDPWGFDLLRREPRLDAGRGAASDAARPSEGAVQDAGRRAACRHCGADGLTIAHGRFGYYWKCGACDGNTVIDKTAADGRQGKKLRKQGRDFFLVFDDGEEVLFHTNPETEAATTS